MWNCKRNFTLDTKLFTIPAEPSLARWTEGESITRRQQFVMSTRRDTIQARERTTAKSAAWKPYRPPLTTTVTTRPGAARRKPQGSAVFLTLAAVLASHCRMLRMTSSSCLTTEFAVLDQIFTTTPLCNASLHCRNSVPIFLQPVLIPQYIILKASFRKRRLHVYFRN